MSTVPNDPRYDLILKVARRHFIGAGYAATGMEAIARDAGVSTATLYLYFPGKAELFDRMMDAAANEFINLPDRLPDQGGAREQIMAFSLGYARFTCDPFVRSVFRLVITERRRLSDAAGRFINKGRTEFGAPLIQMLVRLRDQGLVRMDKPSWAAGQLMGMIDHPTCLVPLVTGEDASCARSPEAIATDAVDTFMARYAAVQG